MSTRNAFRWLPVPLALLVTSAVVYQASFAAFSAQTSNTGNTWSSGTVALSDDDAGTALFTATGLAPGETGSACIAVSYTGSLAAEERMYGTVTGSGLAAYLDIAISSKDGSFARDCAAFDADADPAAPVFSGTLAGFGTAHPNFATGTAPVAVTSGDTITYKITYTVADDNAAQGLDAGADFTWETQST